MSEDVQERLGVVTPEPDGQQLLEFVRSWPDPIDDVWSALTDPERSPRWIGRYDGERVPGGTGTFTMTFEEGSEGSPVRIAECAPPHRLVVEWIGPGWRLEVDLSRQEERTVLRFRQRFAPDADVADFALGWHWYLDKLSAELGDGPDPGVWDDFYARVGPAYRA
jgi:uncharacterized protein YndB with AHSA1/START domain